MQRLSGEVARVEDYEEENLLDDADEEPETDAQRNCGNQEKNNRLHSSFLTLRLVRS